MSVKTECPLCGECAMHETRGMVYCYKGHERAIPQPGIYCDACGESTLGPTDLKKTRKAIATFHAEVDHLLPPDEIRRIRKKVKWTQAQAAGVLGGGVNGFSRYETGLLSPPPLVNTVLVLIDQEPSTANKLLAIQFQQEKNCSPNS